MFIITARKNRRAKNAALEIIGMCTADLQKLEQLRYDNPSNGALQLHCDRMHVLVTTKRDSFSDQFVALASR